MKIFGGTLEMKAKKLLVSVKCIIFLCLILFISGCATYKQHGFPSVLLGTWLYEYENADGFYFEQAFTFNLDGSGTVETRQFGNLNWGGKILRVFRPEDVSIFYLLPSSQRGKIDLIANDSYGQISFKVDNNYLFISGISQSLFDQSVAKYRKLSDAEVEKWLNPKGTPLSEM